MNYKIGIAVLVLLGTFASIPSAEAKKPIVNCPGKQKLHRFFSHVWCSNTVVAPELGSGHTNESQPTRSISDVRLKHDLLRVGTAADGLPLYDFQYNGQPGVYEGVMAQDVLKLMPAAVSVGSDGFYRVNYSMLGIKFRRIH